MACALAGAVNLFAQEQAPPAQEHKEAAPPKSTLTGCVVQAKTTDGGTAYILSKVEGGTAPIYVLAGSTTSDWSSNVNKKVEVTGAVQTPPDAGAGAAADPKVLRPPMVVVESVKVVAQACS
jgi:hypothetical protein